MSSDSSSVSFWILKIFVPLAFLLLFESRGALVNDVEPLVAMEAFGFTDVTIVRKDWFFVGLRGCGHTDAAKYTVKATNPVGRKVEVLVCASVILKGSTIRTR